MAATVAAVDEADGMVLMVCVLLDGRRISEDSAAKLSVVCMLTNAFAFDKNVWWPVARSWVMVMPLPVTCLGLPKSFVLARGHEIMGLTLCTFAWDTNRECLWNEITSIR